MKRGWNQIRTSNIRVLKHRRLITKLNTLLLEDKGKQFVLPRHYDKRSQKHSRIDDCFESFNLESSSLETVCFPFSDNKILNVFEKGLSVYHNSCKLNDVIRDEANDVSASLQREIPLLGSIDEIGLNYDKFEANVRDHLRLLGKHMKQTQWKMGLKKNYRRS